MLKIFFGAFGLVRRNKVLSLILLLAAFLRFVGISPGYHPYHSDEGMSYSSAIEMIRNLNIDPGRYDYPSLVPFMHMVIYVVFFIPLFIVKSLLFSPEDLPTKGKTLVELWQQTVLQNQQTAVLFWGRWITALFGIGIVYLVYLVAKKLFADRRIGLVAAFLVAVNFREVLNSHLGLPDIYNAFFLLLAIYSFGTLLQNPTTKNYLLSGATIGLFFSTKLQMFALLPYFLSHLFILSSIFVQDSRKKLIVKFLSGRGLSASRSFLLGLLVTLILVLVLNPYHLLNWDKFLSQESYNLLKYRLGVNMLNIYAISYLYHVGIGQVISLFVIFGSILSLVKYTRSSLIILSAVLPFLYFFFYYSGGGYYTRNFVTIIPLLLVFASVFIVRFWDFLLGHKRFVSSAIVFSVLAVSFSNIQNSFISSFYFSQPWGFRLAHDWAGQNIQDGAKVVSHPWDNYPRDKNLEIITFDPPTVFSLAEMREEGASYGFLNMDWMTLGSYWWMNRDVKTSLSFWQKPDELMWNTFNGVAAQELADYAVAKFVKPWQAPDMNFLIVKVPPLPKVERKVLVASYDFDTKETITTWSSVDGDWTLSTDILLDDREGKSSLGSLRLKEGQKPLPVVRVVSPLLPLGGEDRVYVVEGWIKSGTILDKKMRDGYLRVDFYKDDPGKIGLKTRSLQSNISSRFFGGTEWSKKELVVFPPKEAKFMSVGVQVNNYTDFWFDDIKIYRQEDIENPKEKGGYIDYQIPDDVLFPYSQGNL